MTLPLPLLFCVVRYAVTVFSLFMPVDCAASRNVDTVVRWLLVWILPFRTFLVDSWLYILPRSSTFVIDTLLIVISPWLTVFFLTVLFPLNSTGPVIYCLYYGTVPMQLMRNLECDIPLNLFVHSSLYYCIYVTCCIHGTVICCCGDGGVDDYRSVDGITVFVSLFDSFLLRWSSTVTTVLHGDLEFLLLLHLVVRAFDCCCSVFGVVLEYCYSYIPISLFCLVVLVVLLKLHWWFGTISVIHTYLLYDFDSIRWAVRLSACHCSTGMICGVR